MANEVITDLILQDVHQLRDQLAEVMTNVSLLKQELERMKTDLDEYIAQRKELIEQFKKDAFVEGDPVAHRLEHEKKVQEDQDTKDLKKEVTSKVIQGATWAAILGLFWASVESIKNWLMK